MKKSLIAVAASLAMAATFTATAPVAASAAGNDHVELCRPLVDSRRAARTALLGLEEARLAMN